MAIFATAIKLGPSMSAWASPEKLRMGSIGYAPSESATARACRLALRDRRPACRDTSARRPRRAAPRMPSAAAGHDPACVDAFSAREPFVVVRVVDANVAVDLGDRRPAECAQPVGAEARLEIRLLP